MITLSDALVHYYQDKKWILDGLDYSGLNWISEDVPKPTETELQLKIQELQAAEPLRLLRQQRNKLLAATDWRFRSDLTPSQAWIDYCQALRDLPANSTPSLDSDGNLTGITWPTPPND